MKLFTDYINSYNDEQIYSLNEGFISNVANWLGEKGKNLTSVVNDLKNFPKKVKLAYGGMNANLINKKDTLSEEDRKRITQEINDRRVGKEQMEYIQQEWKDHGDDNNYKTSGFMTYALLYGKELAVKENDKDAVDFFDKGIKSISEETKQKAKEIRDNAKENNSEEKTNNEDEVIKNDGEDVSKEEVNSEIKNNVSKDPLQDLTNFSKLDNKKLKDAIEYLIWDNNKNKSTEDLNKIIIGLGAIICGTKLLSDDSKLDPKILQGWNIPNIQEILKTL